MIMRIGPINNVNRRINFTSEIEDGPSYKHTNVTEPDCFVSHKQISDNKFISFFQNIFLSKDDIERYKTEQELIVLAKERNKNYEDCPIYLNFKLDNDDTPVGTLGCKLYSLSRLKELKNMIYLPDNSRQLEASELAELLRADNFSKYLTKINDYKLLYDIPNRSKQLSLTDIINMSKNLPDEAIQRIQKYRLLENIDGREKELTLEEAKNIGLCLSPIIKNIFKYGLLKDIPERKITNNDKSIVNMQMSVMEVIDLANIIPQNNEGKLLMHRIKSRKLLTDKFGSESYLYVHTVADLAKLKNKEWNKIKESGILKYHENFDKRSINDFIKLPDEKLEKAKHLVSFKYCAEKELKKFIELPDKVSDKVLNFLENEDYKIDINAILYLLKFDKNILKLKNQAKEEAILKRNQLRDGVGELKDSDINKFFQNFELKICAAIDLLGLNTFVHSYSMKLEGVNDLIDAVENLVDKNNMLEIERRHLKSVLANKSISPEDKISKVMTLSVVADNYDIRKHLISLIKPNTPTKEQLDNAKGIWAQHGKTFDEKYTEFCGAFSISPDNEKVKNFFVNRASKNSKGYKILNNISTSDLAQLLAVEVVKPENDRQWNNYINKLIADKYELSDDKYFFKKVDLTKSKYLSEILRTSDDTEDNIITLFELIKGNPHKSIKTVLDELPQNISTKELFNDFGINYDKWTVVDKNSFVKVKVETDADAARKASVMNLVKDLTDTAFKSLPREERYKIFKALKSIGVTLKKIDVPDYDTNGFYNSTKKVLMLVKDEKPVAFSDMPKIISIIKTTINSNEFWTKELDNKELNSARNTMYNHFIKLRDNEIKNANNLKTNVVSDIEVRKVDMNDIGYSLFLGNYAGCCTAIGSSVGNDFAAARYIMDKFIQAIEVVDGKNPVGNTMCYLAKVDDELSLVLDNIELTAKYQNNDFIRDAIFKYAEKLCKEIGQPDMPIYAGPYRHKVNMDGYPLSQEDVTIIGDTDGNETYIDFAGDISISIDDVFQTDLYRIK